jgi:hypothetical protein
MIHVISHWFIMDINLTFELLLQSDYGKHIMEMMIMCYNMS